MRHVRAFLRGVALSRVIISRLAVRTADGSGAASSSSGGDLASGRSRAGDRPDRQARRAHSGSAAAGRAPRPTAQIAAVNALTGNYVPDSAMPNFPWPGHRDAPAGDAALEEMLSGTGLPEDLSASLRPASDVLATLGARPSGYEPSGLTEALAEFRARVGVSDSAQPPRLPVPPGELADRSRQPPGNHRHLHAALRRRPTALADPALRPLLQASERASRVRVRNCRGL